MRENFSWKYSCSCVSKGCLTEDDEDDVDDDTTKEFQVEFKRIQYE